MPLAPDDLGHITEKLVELERIAIELGEPELAFMIATALQEARREAERRRNERRA